MNHEKADKHIRRVQDSATTKPLPVIHIAKEDDQANKAEIELAVTMACHSAIMTIDHLGEVITKNGKGSKLEKIKLHRRKCTKIIMNVVATAMKEDLTKDVKGKKYSIIADESTDISTTKLLCAMIRYHSEKENKIMTAFVDLVPGIEAYGENLFHALKTCLNGIGLKLNDCIGYGCDGVSVMVGEHNSVWSRIRSVAPNCIQVKCICHYLALCVKHAFDKLPSRLGFLLSEIPKCFSKSTVRRDAFTTLFNVMDAGNARMGTPSPFQKSSTTRWLVRGKIIYDCLVNWEELRAYFTVAIPETNQESRCKARTLWDMLNDRIIFLYFHFVSPLVTEFERVNALFQATDADPEEMSKELLSHSKSLQARINDSDGSTLPIEKVDFGGKFEEETRAFLSSQADAVSALDKIKELKQRCILFLMEATDQVKKRLPESHNLFRGLSSLHPMKVLHAREETFQPAPLATFEA